MPIHPLAEPSRDEWREKGTQIDAGIEHRKPGVAPCATLWIEITDYRRDIRLEQSRADHDENETDKERATREERRKADREMAEGDEDAAGPDRSLQTEPAIGDPPARQRREIDRGCVNADNRARRLAVETKTALCEGGGHE